MDGDTIKLVMLGLGGVLIGSILFRGGGKGNGGTAATLESMRISSATNIAYANAGVENSRILSSLAAEKDRNRTSIQIAAGEQQTQRHSVNRLSQLEGYRIATDRSKFYRQLQHETGMFRRWLKFEDAQLGKSQQHEIDLAKVNQSHATQIARINADVVRYSADRGVQVAIGEQGIEQSRVDNAFISSLIGQGARFIGGIGDAYGWGSSDVRRGYGYGGGPYGSGEYDTYRAPSYVTRPRQGGPAGAGGGTGGTTDDLMTVGSAAAAGCAAGPWGCLVGAILGGGYAAFS